MARERCITLVLRKLTKDREVEESVGRVREQIREAIDSSLSGEDLVSVLEKASDLCRESKIERVTCSGSDSCKRYTTEECPAWHLGRFIRQERTVCLMSSAVRRSSAAWDVASSSMKSNAIKLSEAYLDALTDYLRSERETLSVVLERLVAQSGSKGVSSVGS